MYFDSYEFMKKEGMKTKILSLKETLEKRNIETSFFFFVLFIKLAISHQQAQTVSDKPMTIRTDQEIEKKL